MLSNPASANTVIELTQVPCQFLESEPTDHGFSANSADDCKDHNKRTGDSRAQQSQPLELKAGKYTFRVTNKNVPYPLGFWLRGEGVIGRATLPSVSGGGLATGTTLDYEITLEPGEYLYSCPLNPTPDYKLVVR
ncbi:hypothetical protein DV711_18770 [Motiliproteus coralliicola]|uniref:Blue (type 1) copper domain-containing protein n=2 Tax=Motiliproteus coralliicola TaxID=2283196 RepID=A0A369WA83_9GAMM|nr:hypothetical protein DV711_18770 [Motiliproteus coralliicola]